MTKTLIMMFFILGLLVLTTFMLLLPRSESDGIEPNENSILGIPLGSKHIYMHSVPRSAVSVHYENGGNTTVIELNGTYVAYPTDEWNTYSMNPAFGKGNIIIVEFSPKNVSVGDFVGVDRDGLDGVSHQVIRITDECINTKGTNNLAEDEVCWTMDDVVYRIVGTIYTEAE